MNKDEVMNSVNEIVTECFGVGEEHLTPETSFVNDLGAKRLDLIELVVMFEEEFDIDISLVEEALITTIGEAVDLIISKLRG